MNTGNLGQFMDKKSIAFIESENGDSKDCYHLSYSTMVLSKPIFFAEMNDPLIIRFCILITSDVAWSLI